MWIMYSATSFPTWPIPGSPSIRIGSTGFFSLNLSVYETVISSIMVVGQPAVFAVLVFRREPCRMCYCRRLPADRTGGRKSIDIVCRAVPDAPGHALFPDFGFLTSL